MSFSKRGRNFSTLPNKIPILVAMLKSTKAAHMVLQLRERLIQRRQSL